MPYVSTKRRAPAKKRKRTRRRKSNPRFGKHRPVLRYTRTGWRRPKRSILRYKKTGRKMKINRRRRAPKRLVRRAAPRRTYVARRRRRTYRRNPTTGLKALTSQKLLMGGIKIGGGIVAGGLMLPLVAKIMPAEQKVKYGQYLGGLNVLVGGLMIGFLKNKDLKDIGLVIAGTGIYDLIASNFPQLGLPPIPKDNPMIDKTLGEPVDNNGNGTVDASYAPLGYSAGYARNASPMSASYSVGHAPVSPAARALAASYNAPGLPTEGFQGDNPYANIEGWEPTW